MTSRHILEGLFVMHETVHELHRKKTDGVLVKIDFEKAYNKVKWRFLKQVLRTKGFDAKWCQWVHDFIHKLVVGIKVNNDVCQYFKTQKGLRKGDPTSPIPFNIVVLAILVAREK
jgi:hypothetical protein